MPERLPYHSSVYIGMTGEDIGGELFAMSPSQYPFVAFRDGASHPSQVDRVAEPPPPPLPPRSDMDDFTEEVVHGKEEEARCLDLNIIEYFLGVRPLVLDDGEDAETRIRRLLEGPHSDKY